MRKFLLRSIIIVFLLLFLGQSFSYLILRINSNKKIKVQRTTSGYFYKTQFISVVLSRNLFGRIRIEDFNTFIFGVHNDAYIGDYGNIISDDRGYDKNQTVFYYKLTFLFLFRVKEELLFEFNEKESTITYKIMDE